MPSVYTVDLPSIEQVVKFFPVKVTPDTLLIDVILMMSISGNGVAKSSNAISALSWMCKYQIAQTQVKNIMSKPIFTVSANESLWNVQQLMKIRGIRRLIVVSEQAKLQGIVTQTNLLKVLDPGEVIKVIQVLECKFDQQTEELKENKLQLEQEIAQRRIVEESLRQAQEKLELEVAERTAELMQANLHLQKEIDEHRKAQQTIREQAALIDFTTDAIFVRDVENHILFWSKGAEKLYTWKAEESLGKLADKIFSVESLSQLEIGLKTTLEVGYWQGELEQITKTGKLLIVASRWTLIKNKFGHQECILVINTDITEKKLLEQQFYRAQRLESIGTLASGIAHDLNNVFAPMMMIAQLLPLRCKNVDPRTQEMLKILENSCKRGANLVKQILTFARGNEGKHIPLQSQILLKELVTVIKETFPKSITISTVIPTDDLWIVEADPTQLEQVLMNLAVNARDAMPNGGILTINAENRIINHSYKRKNVDAKTGNYVEFTIADTGMGIPPEILYRMFDPFFTTKNTGEGTGLGLSTVLGIVKNHGGFIDVSSQVGKGTKFQVFLPTVEKIIEDDHIDEELPRGNGDLILVVDDEDLIRQTTQQTLERYGYQILLANDGREAIKIYSQYQQKIKAVLLDMVMPNMDGFITMKMFRNYNFRVKIIATSGLPWQEKSIKAGAQKFLSKPYSVPDLLTTLSDILGNW